ncbi:MAG: hypothetical protein JF585_02765 [Burkholderiales bacterium]|nr:hypothetical protein [Burkholderiales bacterium]
MDTQDRAARIADDIRDAEHYLTVLGGATQSNLPWKRQLRARVSELSDLLQVVTMAVMMDRPEAELREATSTLAERARLAKLAIAGSRADLYVHATLKLVVGLARRIHDQLEAHALHEASVNEE